MGKNSAGASSKRRMQKPRMRATHVVTPGFQHADKDLYCFSGPVLFLRDHIWPGCKVSDQPSS